MGGGIAQVAAVAGHPVILQDLDEGAIARARAGIDKALARETARFSLNVNCVCPGPTDTPLLASIPEKQRDALIRAIPFRRFAKPSEVADAVLFFAGGRTDYLTGQVLSVSGGLTMVD